MNDVGVIAAINDGIGAAQNLGPAMEAIGGELLAISDRAFMTESDPSTGAPWAPLKASTLRQRRKEGHDGKILQRTGELMRRVQVEFSSRSVAIGGGVEYSLVHHLGGTPNQGIPARPYVGATPEEIDDFGEIIADFILNRIN